MERIQQTNSDRDSANSKRAAQGKFAANPAQRDLASSINNSPGMIAQRKKLQSLFGGAVQMKEGGAVNDGRGREAAIQRISKSIEPSSIDVLVGKEKGKKLSSPPSVQQPIQLATEDLTLNGATSTVATSMTATLDPTKPPSYGQASSDDSDLDAIMGTLPTDPKHDNTKKFIKGHLLNDNLGGMANKNNLYPITSKANKEHENLVESKIKDYVFGGNLAKVTYTVNVTNRSIANKEMKKKKSGGAYAVIETPKATFECTTTGGIVLNEEIPSEAETRG